MLDWGHPRSLTSRALKAGQPYSSSLMVNEAVEAQSKSQAADAGFGEKDLPRVIQHVVGALDAAPKLQEPFYHLEMSRIFPDDVYARMLEAMPVKGDYRLMSGRTKSTRMNDGGTRTKIDLFPEYIRHLPVAKRKVWEVVGQALCSPEVREAFRRCLAPGLEHRFGPGYAKVGMYPIPILTRDVPGYKIGIHPDTHCLLTHKF